MKYYYSIKAMTAWIIMLIAAVGALPTRVAAQDSFGFRDDFDYPLGNLYKQGGWVRNGGNDVDPIQVINKSLTYAGYYEKSDGKCVKLGDTKSGEDLQARFTTNDDGVLNGNIYYSALVNIEKAPSKDSYIMGLVLRTKASVVTDTKNGIDLGRLFIGKSENDDEVKVGIERGGTKAVYASTALKLNQTYLVVVRYEISNADPKTGADNVYLYVNPASTKTEPETVSAFIDGVNFTGSGVKNYGLQGIVLRQATTASATAPVAYVASVRVADTYAGLFGEQQESTTPALNIDTKELDLNVVYTGDEYDGVFTVTGSNLKGDVSVESSSTNVEVSPSVLSAADVMSGDGAKVSVKVKYAEGDNAETITLKSEGAKDAVANVSWKGYTVPTIATLKELYDKDPELGEVYLYKGNAVVTYVDKGASSPVYYLQDETAALAVGDDYTSLATENKVGDKLTNVALILDKTLGNLKGIVSNTHLGTLVSENNVVEPKAVTLADFTATPSAYLSQLIKLQGVKFKNVEEGATFAEGMKQPVLTDGTNDVNVKIFKGTTLIGKEIPTADVNVVGISTSAATSIIAPRGIADIETVTPVGDPELTISPEKIERVAGAIGKTVIVATLHVSAKNMTSATFFQLAGKNADQFSVSQSKIEKGSSETDITISYTPTEVALHTAYLNIDCPSITDYYKTIAFSAYAIDELNPPTITIEPTALQTFTAKVGETSEQTFTVTTANMPDYAYVKLKDAGQFLLGNTMLLRNTTNSVKLTFKPTVAGTYNTALVFYALGMDDVEIPVTGVATGAAPTEEKEGVDFTLSEENPLTILKENFNDITRNKPLSIAGWTNSALEGTRAWWGYSFLDYDTESPGENAAKVTAYDSKVESGNGTPAQMILVTPPLDYNNSKSKMFSFKVRGDMLRDNQTDKLELCYVELVDGEPYVEPIAEAKMPCTKDESGKWVPFDVDLANQNIADVFFMAFRFTSTRGSDNAATYYIDDVTYGQPISTGINTVSSSAEAAIVAVYDLSGNMVSSNASTTVNDALKGLTPGFYVVKSTSADGTTVRKVQLK